MSRDKYEHTTLVGSCHPLECPSCKQYVRPNDDRYDEAEIEDIYVCWYESPRVIEDWEDDERYIPMWCPLRGKR